MRTNENLCVKTSPSEAILVFRTSENAVYMEIASFNEKAGEFNMGERRPVSMDFIVGLTKAVRNTHARPISCHKRIMPSNLLYFQQQEMDYKLIWFRPAYERIMKFKSRKAKVGKVIFPASIRMASKDDLSIFIVKDGKQPQMNTPLFYCPTTNIYEDGKLCLGSSKNPSHTLTEIADIMEAWDEVFDIGTFTDVEENDRIKSGDILKLYNNLFTKKRVQPFPQDELLPMLKAKKPLTLQHLIK